MPEDPSKSKAESTIVHMVASDSLSFRPGRRRIITYKSLSPHAESTVLYFVRRAPASEPRFQKEHPDSG